MGSFLQGLAGGIQQAQENRLHRAQMEHLQAQTEHMKAQADQVKQFHTLLKTMTQPAPGTELEGPGAPIPAFKPGELNPEAHTPDVMDLGQAMQQEGPRPLSPPGPSQMDTMLAGYSPEARSFLSAALQTGDPNTVSAIMTRLMNRPGKEYQAFDAGKDIYQIEPGQAPKLFKAGEAKSGHITLSPGQIVIDPATGKQIAAGPAKEETPKSPLTVSDENRVANELFDKNYTDLGQQQKAKVNEKMKKDKEDIALLMAQGKADVVKPPTPPEREKLTENESSLLSLSRLGNLYKPEYVGPVRGRAGQLRQAFGGTAGVEPLSPEESQFRAEGAAFRNKIIKAITGSAMSANEQDRILKQIPSENDPPQTWEGKYEATVQNMEQHADLFKKILKETKVDISTVPKTTHPTMKQPMAKPDEAKAYLEEQKQKLRETMKGGAHAAQP